jgi:uncharacterized iron-regulated membrane protein
MLFKKINAWLHLWLGLISGIVVFIVSITGCILVFEHEIIDLLHPEQHIQAQDESRLLPPSRLYEAAAATLPGKTVYSVWYHGLDRTAHIEMDADSVIHINPYTAEVVVSKHEKFFRFFNTGHRTLWMGRSIGHQIVGWCTFIFFLLLISGLIMWFPKKWNKAGVNNSFKIKWKANFKRVNYDLHNVLGFYVLLIAVLMATTGMVMSLPWFSKSVYWLTGGTVTERKKPEPVKPFPQNTVRFRVDRAWEKVRKEIASANKNEIIASFPDEPDEAIYLCTDMINGHWRDLYVDPNTLELLPRSGGKMSELSFAKQLRTANYGLHVGAIGGLITKFIYFFGSLICASLPVTGFYIWWRRGKKSAKPAGAKR